MIEIGAQKWLNQVVLRLSAAGCSRSLGHLLETRVLGGDLLELILLLLIFGDARFLGIVGRFRRLKIVYVIHVT